MSHDDADTDADAGEDPAVSTLLRGTADEWPSEDAARERVRAHWRSMLAARRRRRWVQTTALAAGLAGLLVLATVLWRAAASWPPQPSPSVTLGLATIELVVPGTEGPAAGDGAPPLRVGDRAGAAGEAVAAGVVVETSPLALAALRAGPTSRRIDVGTRLRLLPGNRIELERGAVYLDTPAGRGGADPFVVATAAGSCREIGTRFEVRVDGGTMHVRVRDGAVELRAKSGATTRVEAGHELQAGARVDAGVRPAPSAGPGWEWAARVAPQPPLGGATLADLLAWVNRETGAEVAFVHAEDSATARNTILHGPLDGLDPVSAVGVALPTCGLEGRFVEGRLVIDRLP